MKLKKLYRALSVTLSLTLCVSLAIPAFADNKPTKPTDDQQKVLDETVYVYLNVGEGTVQDGAPPAMPSLAPPSDEIVKAVEEAKKELDGANTPPPLRQ